MTQGDLAKLANAGGASRISNYEQGVTEPDMETLKRISIILEVPVGYWFEDDIATLKDAPLPARRDSPLEGPIRAIVKEEINSALSRLAEKAASIESARSTGQAVRPTSAMFSPVLTAAIQSVIESESVVAGPK